MARLNRDGKVPARTLRDLEARLGAALQDAAAAHGLVAVKTPAPLIGYNGRAGWHIEFRTPEVHAALEAQCPSCRGAKQREGRGCWITCETCKGTGLRPDAKEPHPC